MEFRSGLWSSGLDCGVQDCGVQVWTVEFRTGEFGSGLGSSCLDWGVEDRGVWVWTVVATDLFVKVFQFDAKSWSVRCINVFTLTV